MYVFVHLHNASMSGEFDCFTINHPSLLNISVWYIPRNGISMTKVIAKQCFKNVVYNYLQSLKDLKYTWPDCPDYGCYPNGHMHLDTPVHLSCQQLFCDVGLEVFEPLHISVQSGDDSILLPTYSPGYLI